MHICFAMFSGDEKTACHRVQAEKDVSSQELAIIVSSEIPGLTHDAMHFLDARGTHDSYIEVKTGCPL